MEVTIKWQMGEGTVLQRGLLFRLVQAAVPGVVEDTGESVGLKT